MKVCFKVNLNRRDYSGEYPNEDRPIVIIHFTGTQHDFEFSTGASQMVMLSSALCIDRISDTA